MHQQQLNVLMSYYKANSKVLPSLSHPSRFMSSQNQLILGQMMVRNNRSATFFLYYRFASLLWIPLLSPCGSWQHCVLLHPRQGVQRNPAPGVLWGLSLAKHGCFTHLWRLGQKALVWQKTPKPWRPIWSAGQPSVEDQGKKVMCTHTFKMQSNCLWFAMMASVSQPHYL